jgi:hypothetical protein
VSLSTNAENEDLNIRMTSLTTLGYICEELSPYDFVPELRSLIVKAIVQNLTDSPHLLEATRQAVKALPNVIPYASEVMQQ